MPPGSLEENDMVKIDEQVIVFDGSATPNICSATFQDVCVLPSGRILVSWRGGPQKGPINMGENGYYCISDDGGKTWTEPEMLLDSTGGAPPHLIQLSSGAIVSTYSRRKQPYGIMAMVSLDGGETWEKDLRLYENTASDDLGYPSTIELDDSTLLSVFYATDAENKPCTIRQQRWELIL